MSDQETQSQVKSDSQYHLASPAQRLPEPLKSGIEALSGVSMDDVRVHYNSSKPAEVQALAYAQQPEIYLAPGQEKHLAHEAWHVVQQKQGRVRPMLQAKGIAINDDENLEREANLMGNKALSLHSDPLQTQRITLPDTVDGVQEKNEHEDIHLAVIQRVFDGFLKDRTTTQVFELVEQKYEFDPSNKGKIMAALEGYSTVEKLYSTTTEVAKALQESKLIGGEKQAPGGGKKTVKLYHTTSCENLNGIAVGGLQVKRSGQGGFTSLASSISGDKSAEEKRVATSSGKIHLANLVMALSYFDAFKMQPEVDKIVDPIVQAKIEEMLLGNPKLKRYDLNARKPEFIQEVMKQPEVQKKVAKILGPKALLMIYEEFTEAAFYDHDPDESSGTGFRAVRKSKDIPATSLLIVTTEGAVALGTYMEKPEKYTLITPEQIVPNEEDETVLEEFMKKFPT